MWKQTDWQKTTWPQDILADPQLQPTMRKMACGNSQQSSGQNLRKQIWDACNGTKAEAYWSKKYRMDQARVKELDTKALEQAMDESMPACHHWVSKHVTGHFTHGRVMQHRGMQMMAQCPWCPHNEDKLHVLRHPAPEACIRWWTSLAWLNQWFNDQGTDSILMQQLIQYLHKSWGQTHALTAKQLGIVINQLANRWLAKAWQHHQEAIQSLIDMQI